MKAPLSFVLNSVLVFSVNWRVSFASLSATLLENVALPVLLGACRMILCRFVTGCKIHPSKNKMCFLLFSEQCIRLRSGPLARCGAAVIYWVWVLRVTQQLFISPTDIQYCVHIILLFRGTLIELQTPPQSITCFSVAVCQENMHSDEIRTH